MLSQTTEYALRAVVCMAEDPQTSKTAQHIAKITKVPVGYLSKILQQLARAGLARAQRGPNGGFVLSRPIDQITILDVINVIEPIQRIEQCPLGIPGHAALCPLHRRIDQALASVAEAFGSTTFADLLAEPSRSKPLCRVSVSARPKRSPARAAQSAGRNKKKPRRA